MRSPANLLAKNCSEPTSLWFRNMWEAQGQRIISFSVISKSLQAPGVRRKARIWSSWRHQWSLPVFVFLWHWHSTTTNTITSTTTNNTTSSTSNLTPFDSSHTWHHLIVWLHACIIQVTASASASTSPECWTSSQSETLPCCLWRWKINCGTRFAGNTEKHMFDTYTFPDAKGM